PLVAGLSFFFLESNLKTKQKHGACAVLCLALLLSGCVGGNGSKAITATPPASTTVTVSIASPSNGAALTSSSVHVLATAAGQQPIRTLVISLDGAQVATASGSGGGARRYNRSERWILSVQRLQRQFCAGCHDGKHFFFDPGQHGDRRRQFFAAVWRVGRCDGCAHAGAEQQRSQWSGNAAGLD